MNDSRLGLVDYDLGRLSEEMLEILIDSSGRGTYAPKIALAIRNALIEGQRLRLVRGRTAEPHIFSLPPLNLVELLEGLEGLKFNLKDFDRHAAELREGYLFCVSLALTLKSQADAMSAAETGPAN